MMRLILDGACQTQYWGGASVAMIMGTRVMRASSSTLFEEIIEQIKELTELIGSVLLLWGPMKNETRVGTGGLTISERGE